MSDAVFTIAVTGTTVYAGGSFTNVNDHGALYLEAAYLARWEVEVHFRDEKILLGVVQAQVRNAQAMARAPAFLVAAYAMLLWSNFRVFGDRRTDAFERLPAYPEPAAPR